MALMVRPAKWKVGDTQAPVKSAKDQKTGSGKVDVQARKKNKLIFSKPLSMK